MTTIRTTTLTVLLIVVLGACQPVTDQSSNAAEEVRAADIAWAQAFSRKDMAGYLAFVDSGASIQQPNGPTVTGTDEIRALIEGFFGLPDLRGTWQPTSVKSSLSGDLAYSTGTFELTFSDPEGNPAMDRGKYLEIWRKQADGSWKMVLESFNSDLPLPEVSNPAP